MFEQYRMRNGETLASVAKKYQTSVSTLKEINNIYFDEDLRAGSELVVPKMDETYYTYYKVEQGDSLYAIARKYNINPELLASMNGIDLDDYIYPDQEIMIPKSGYSYYITKEGDTLNTVATMFETTDAKLLEHNPTIYLHEGQILVNKI